MPIQITFVLTDALLASYLKHYNEVFSTNFTVENLTEGQRAYLAQSFGEMAEAEMQMRSDDHSAFETENEILLLKDTK